MILKAFHQLGIKSYTYTNKNVCNNINFDITSKSEEIIYFKTDCFYLKQRYVAIYSSYTYSSCIVATGMDAIKTFYILPFFIALLINKTIILIKIKTFLHKVFDSLLPFIYRFIYVVTGFQNLTTIWQHRYFCHFTQLNINSIKEHIGSSCSYKIECTKHKKNPKCK